VSYILDAIRKSDLQRSRGAAPTLLTSHAEAVTTGRPLPTLYIAIALALLVAGIAIGWWHPWQWQPSPLPAAPETANNNSPAQLVSPVPALPAPAPAPKFEREIVLPKPVAAPAATSPAPAAVPNIAVVAPPAPTPAPAPGISAVDKATIDATGEAKTLNFAELPPAIQQEIPRMSISVHAYSSQPKNRLVSIDDHLLHEGDNAGAGLKLEQITPDGMIFSYKGYRFRRSVKEVVNNR
jgi:general secretion pathway protein B